MRELLSDPLAFMIWSIALSACVSALLVWAVAVVVAKALDFLVLLFSEKGDEDNEH